MLLLGAIAIVMLRRKSIQRGLTKIRGWVKSVFLPSLKIEEIKEVSARAEDRLKCPCGKPLDLILECGHLSTCEQCYKEKEEVECRLCGQLPARVQKVYP